MKSKIFLGFNSGTLENDLHSLTLTGTDDCTRRILKLGIRLRSGMFQTSTIFKWMAVPLIYVGFDTYKVPYIIVINLPIWNFEKLEAGIGIVLPTSIQHCDIYRQGLFHSFERVLDNRFSLCLRQTCPCVARKYLGIVPDRKESWEKMIPELNELYWTAYATPKRNCYHQRIIR